ncbi:MAG: GGGtGRT protein, partial [Clostridia bacterium]
MAVTFESYSRRIDKINKALALNNIKDLEDARKICLDNNIDVESIVKGIQPIAFDNAVWAYIVGCAIAIKKHCVKATDAAVAIGEGLQSFCIPGSVADQRAVGLGHGNLASMLLKEETRCFAFLAGHESFAAAEGAIGIAKTANKVRTQPLQIILNGLGKDAAKIISRINGFTYVHTQLNHYDESLDILDTTAYSDGERSQVRV